MTQSITKQLIVTLLSLNIFISHVGAEFSLEELCPKNELANYGVALKGDPNKSSLLCESTAKGSKSCCDVTTQLRVSKTADEEEKVSKAYYLSLNLIHRYILGFGKAMLEKSAEIIELGEKQKSEGGGTEEAKKDEPPAETAALESTPAEPPVEEKKEEPPAEPPVEEKKEESPAEPPVEEKKEEMPDPGNSTNMVIDVDSRRRRLRVLEENPAEQPNASSPPRRVSASCLQAANDFVLKFTESEKNVIPLYNRNVQKMVFEQSAQVSTYCFLCDSSSKAALAEDSGAKTLRYSKSFCAKLVDKTLFSLSEFHQLYNPMLSLVLNMLTCLSPADWTPPENPAEGSDDALLKQFFALDTNQPDWESAMSPALAKFMKDPLGLGPNEIQECREMGTDNPAFLKACASVCSRFSLVRANPFFDGDFQQQRVFYRLLQRFEKGFSKTAGNVFKDDPAHIRELVDNNVNKLVGNELFMKPVSGKQGLEEYAVVVDSGNDVGFNPDATKFRKAKGFGRELMASFDLII